MLQIKYSGRSQVPSDVLQNRSAVFTFHEVQRINMLTIFKVL